MGSEQNGKDSEQMRRMVQEAVRKALAEHDGSSSARPGRVAHGRGAAAPTREQIRQIVAEELAHSAHGSAGGSSGPDGGSSSSGTQTGWGRFRQKRASSSGSRSARTAGGPPKSAGQSSSQSVAEVLGQAQWQLSEDLSANLKELRRVINQSQEIARKIEQVLGQGTSGQSE